VPPQHLFDKLRRYITKEDILNYFKIGYGIHFYLNNKEPEGIILRNKMKFDRKIDEKLKYDDLKRKLDEDWRRSHVKTHDDWHNDYGSSKKDSIYSYEFLIPSYLRNHMPHRYFIAMEHLKSEKVVPMVGCL